MINANAAKKMVTKFYKLEERNQLKAIEKKIIKAAKLGETEITHNFPLEPGTIAELGKNGYTMKQVHYSRYIISWE